MRFDMSQMLLLNYRIIGVNITPLKNTLNDFGQKFCVYPCVGTNNKYIYVGIDEYVEEAYGFQMTVYALSPKSSK